MKRALESPKRAPSLVQPGQAPPISLSISLVQTKKRLPKTISPTKRSDPGVPQLKLALFETKHSLTHIPKKIKPQELKSGRLNKSEFSSKSKKQSLGSKKFLELEELPKVPATILETYSPCKKKVSMCQKNAHKIPSFGFIPHTCKTTKSITFERSSLPSITPKFIRRFLPSLKEKVLKDQTPSVQTKGTDTSSVSSKKVKLIKSDCFAFNLNEADLGTLVAIEKFTYDFMLLTESNGDFYDLFKNYIEFIQETDLEGLLIQLSTKQAELVKIAICFERLTFLSCFYLELSQMFKSEIFFIQKLSRHLYSNVCWIKEVYLKIFPSLKGRFPPRDFDFVFDRNHVEEVTSKIWKILRIQLAFDPLIEKSIDKILAIVEVSTLKEITDQMIQIFKSRFSEKGVVQESDSAPQVAKDSPKKTSVREKKEYTLVLDLDETLIHCDLSKPGGSISYRPYLQEFLEAMSRHYEIVIFTAAMKVYADPILDSIDPSGLFFSQRFYRDDTHQTDNGSFLKDLTKLGFDLEKTIIVDNIPENFENQKSNGIYIKSYFDDPKDRVLLDLIPILETVVESGALDVRSFLQMYKSAMIEIIQRGSLFPSSEICFKK